MKRKLYLAYGSNLNLPQMSVRCPSAQVVGATKIQNMTLLFRGGRNSAVATIEPHKGSSVPVLVWSITPQDEKALDRYEGYPSFYEKQLFEVRVDSQPVTAMAYVMTFGHSAGYPTKSYFDIIYEGYVTAGFNVNVLQEAVRRSRQLMQSELQSTVVGRVSFATGESFSYDSLEEYLRVLEEELPYQPTTGLRFETLTKDPHTRKAVDDLLYDLFGEKNPHGLAFYQSEPEISPEEEHGMQQSF